jgi:hypothetical protein
MKKVLVISGDIVDANMGGVGVRNWELAHALAPHCQVTLAAPNAVDLPARGVEIISFGLEKGDLRPYAARSDVIIAHGFILHFHPYLREMGVPLAVDLYTPYLLESIVWHDQDDWAQWIPAYQEYLRVQLELITAGDFFFCASERQRDYWLGWLHAQKRINPHTYRWDATLRKLIDVVPFGIQDGAPQADRPALKGVHPGIAASDQLVLWSGGLWDWLDPLTAVRAMALLGERRPNLKLYFLGTRHPNPVVQNMKIVTQAEALARELGLYERSVFFGDWVPYAQRGATLAEADLALVSHREHIETRFSFRTRILDCIWAGLPVVSSAGDEMAALVERQKLGVVVPPGDPAALAAGLEAVLEAGGKAAFAPAFEPARQSFRWSAVIRPLLDFCLSPALAPDKGHYLTEIERIRKDTEAFMAQVRRDYEEVVAVKNRQIERYQKSLPLRAYYAVKRLLGKME